VKTHFKDDAYPAGSFAPLNTASAQGLRLRVIHVVNYLRRGGTEFGILKLMEGLGDEHFEHRLCTTRQFDPEFVRAYELEERLSVAAGTSEGFQFPFFRLRKIFQQLKPHIVHTRNWGALEAIPAARLAGVPVVVHSEHGYEVDNMGGLPLRQRLFRRFAYGMADKVFTVTKELRDYHAKQAWISPERIDVLYNGVDTERFSPHAEIRARVRKEFGIPADRIVLGSVGRMVPIKDYGTLLKAAEHLSQKGVNVHVLLVGKGPELDALQAQTGQLQWLRGRVSFLGSSDRVPELLNAMDIFILTSLGEGMSNTLLEAMSTALPVVATRVGGNPEVMSEEQAEWLFSSGDTMALAARLERLALNIDSRTRCGDLGRRRVLQLFSLQEMWRRYRDLYAEAAAKRDLKAVTSSPINGARRKLA
jgi:sugar transferase (PEP-CTERM/EpsH1 system associated)